MTQATTKPMKKRQPSSGTDSQTKATAGKGKPPTAKPKEVSARPRRAAKPSAPAAPKGRTTKKSAAPAAPKGKTTKKPDATKKARAKSAPASAAVKSGTKPAAAAKAKVASRKKVPTKLATRVKSRADSKTTARSKSPTKTKAAAAAKAKVASRKKVPTKLATRVKSRANSKTTARAKSPTKTKAVARPKTPTKVKAQPRTATAKKTTTLGRPKSTVRGQKPTSPTPPKISRRRGRPPGKSTAGPPKRKFTAGKLPQIRANQLVVYPTHGVGRIRGTEKRVIEGNEIQMLEIWFEHEQMTLWLPRKTIATTGLRELSKPRKIGDALRVLRQKPESKRKMWSQRAREYTDKINSGNVLLVAEVLRDLHREDAVKSPPSYSERQLYEQARDRLVQETAVVYKIDQSDALARVEEALSQRPPPRGPNKTANQK